MICESGQEIFQEKYYFLDRDEPLNPNFSPHRFSNKNVFLKDLWKTLILFFVTQMWPIMFNNFF